MIINYLDARKVQKSNLNLKMYPRNPGQGVKCSRTNNSVLNTIISSLIISAFPEAAQHIKYWVQIEHFNPQKIKGFPGIITVLSSVENEAEMRKFLPQKMAKTSFQQ